MTLLFLANVAYSSVTAYYGNVWAKTAWCLASISAKSRTQTALRTCSIRFFPRTVVLLNKGLALSLLKLYIQHEMGKEKWTLIRGGFSLLTPTDLEQHTQAQTDVISVIPPIVCNISGIIHCFQLLLLSEMVFSQYTHIYIILSQGQGRVMND